jgi:oligopeptide transport system substrate-binding protein
MVNFIKRAIVLFLSLAFLYSCSNDPGRDNNNNGERKVAKGNRVYGGTLKVNETEMYQTLYPYKITDAISAFVASQIYEGLVKFNTRDLSIMPCIAEKWEVDTSGTVYTFFLRKGVMFQDNECFPNGKGREVKASDVKYSFELLCTDDENNMNFAATFKDRVLGANKFFEDSKNGKGGELEGIKVIDDYTIQIKLYAPTTSFIYILANPAAAIVAKEAVEKYRTEMRLGTGPFVFDEKASDKDRVILKRNASYYGIDSLGNQLPYLDTVLISFKRTKKEELEEFQKGNVDMVIGLPSESIKELVESQIANFESQPPKFVLERTAEMVTQYYEFNLTRPPFDNVKVRKAFSYAVDRNRIIDEVLKGEAYGPGIYGICPPSFKGYDVAQIKGYEFNPEMAKKLLAEAGYPNGKGFPTVKLELNSGGARNSNVAFEVQKQLMDVLGVNIDLEVVPLAQKLDDAAMGKAEIFRSAWVADYPSPENFLWTLYGGSVPDSPDKPSFPNTPRYRNPEYDKLFDKGKAARTKEEAYKYFLQAEQKMMEDAPIMVLWYDENYRLVQSHVRNLFLNPMRIRDFTEVYLKPVEAKSAPADKDKEEIKK